jgi:adenine/guanine phosphoribosyltransferase-like PRPP-binding protein
MAIAPIISYITGIPLLIVHKENDSSHSEYKVRGLATSSNYIIIDDFIESGKTINHIVTTVKDWADVQMECVGVLLYADVQYIKEIKHIDYWLNINVLDCWGIRLTTIGKKIEYKSHKISLVDYCE